MGCLTVIIFILNIVLSIYVDAMCFVFTQAMGGNNGLGTVIAIVGMIIDNIAKATPVITPARAPFPADFARNG